MKKVLLTISALLISSVMFAKENKVTLKITNVTPDAGKLMISLHTNKEDFGKQESGPHYTIDAENSIVEWTGNFEDGTYVFAVFQDLNGNGKIDYNALKMPKEPYGFTNYKTKAIPNYNKLKVTVDSDCEFEIPLL